LKVRLYRNKIAPSNDVPYIVIDGANGIDVPDGLAVQYEQLRSAFIQARDMILEAYKKAGGEY